MGLLWLGMFCALTPASFSRTRRSSSPLSVLPTQAASPAWSWAPDGRCGRQIPPCAKSKFPERTFTHLLILLGKALVDVQILESPCNGSSCLQHTGKEAVKQAQLYRALSVLSGQGFNFIQMCPQVSVFSPIYSSSFFSLYSLDFAASEWRYPVKDWYFGSTFTCNKKKKSIKTEKKSNSQLTKHASVSAKSVAAPDCSLSLCQDDYLPWHQSFAPLPRILKIQHVMLSNYYCITYVKLEKKKKSWKTVEPHSNIETTDSLL